MIRAVVFDLFHTLVNPEAFIPDGFSYRRELIELLDAEPEHFHHFWDGAYVERETTVLDHGDLVDRYQARRRQPPLTRPQRSMVDRWVGVGKDDALLRPEPAILELVGAVAATVPVGVLSNCHEREVRAWPRSPLAPLVSAVVRSCDIGAMKPDPAAYRSVLDRLDVPAAGCIYVGNGGGDELAGAGRAGFGQIVHMNAYDRVNGILEPEEQARRAGQAEVSVDSVPALAQALLPL